MIKVEGEALGERRLVVWVVVLPRDEPATVHAMADEPGTNHHVLIRVHLQRVGDGGEHLHEIAREDVTKALHVRRIAWRVLSV